MPRQQDAQKFIGESRAPRVQIEYDVELYGSTKKVELPFVAGVMADLSGDTSNPWARWKNAALKRSTWTTSTSTWRRLVQS
jgi:type VI secretion system ImpB/VipA family protein